MTKTVHWIFNRRLNAQDDAAALRDAAAHLGVPWHTVGLVPFSPGIPEIPDIPADAAVICYGAGFVPRALHHPLWRPGIFFDNTTFRWSAFHAAWGDRMLSRNASIFPLEDARARLADGSRLFIRPDADDKSFDGGVHDLGSLDAALAEARSPDGKSIDPRMPVVMAPAVAVRSEFRTVVVAGEVVAASSYRHEGRPALDLYVPNAVIDLVLEAVHLWMPSPVACLDVAIRSDGSLGIVEANCFNAARLYGSNPLDVIEAVTAFVASTPAKMDRNNASA